MNKLISYILIQVLLISFVSAQQFEFKTADFRLTISKTGHLIEMSNPLNGKNYLTNGQNGPLLKIRVGTEWEEPSQATYNYNKSIITLIFKSSNVTAQIKTLQKKTHLTFELISQSEENKVNAVYWGPFPTIIEKTIGEVVGVVRDGEYAIGLQSLNTKTLGGELKNAEGVDFSRGSVAVKQVYGSSLQAYSLDRSKSRNITVWGENYPNMLVDPIAHETTTGSKIALFGCAESQVLDRIGEIEVAEGLPHPMINGVWMKQSPETGRAYLISDFNEENVDAMLAYTKQAGLMSLYHEGPFRSWGHFILDPQRFPNGNAGMKACVEKASKLGLRIGVHTLTTFINTNDPYVSPIPDHRLATTGKTLLSESTTSVENEIQLESNQYFKNLKPSTLHAVRIGDEIIRFREVTLQPPYKLLDCQRGAFGTIAADHKKGETACMLLDYPYETLFPNFDLQQEIAGNLARFFSETGVSQMDFDGHEGCYSSGEGDYGMQSFAEKVMRETNHTLVNGTSRSSHYYWHICHYWNWGEPWYGGFRESQGDYRLDNQPFIERNYMPNMLGWFLLSATTTAEDIEWMMARAAGYNAGFAMVASYKNLQQNQNTAQLLELIRLWQEAYKSKVFSSDQLERLKNPANDFHLEKYEENYKLYPYSKYTFEHTKQTLQPGQPTFTTWEFENKDAEQPLAYSLTIVGKEGMISNPWIELDGFYKIELPGDFNAGFSIVSDGDKIKLYNEKGSFTKEIISKKTIPVLKTGKHTLKFNCDFPGEQDLKIRFIVKTIRGAELIKVRNPELKQK